MMTPGLHAAVRPRGPVFLLPLCAFAVSAVTCFAITTLAWGLNVDTLIYSICILLLLLFAFSIWTWTLASGSLFDPYVLFLIAAYLFNAGLAFLEVFRLNPVPVLQDRFTSDTVLRTLALVALSLAAFHAGALLSTTHAFPVGRTARRSGDSAQISASLRIVGWAFLLISAVPALIVLKDSVEVVMSTGYRGLFARDMATGLAATPRVLAAYLVPAALFLLAGGRGRPRAIAISALVITSYSALQFFLGARSVAVMPLVAYAWLFHRRIRSLPRAGLLIFGTVLLLVVFPLVKEVRSMAGSERLEYSVFVDAYSAIDNPAFAIISEMGGSASTVAYTLEYVPNVRPFDHGIGYLYALTTVIPNLFGAVHPAIDHGLGGDWLTRLVVPNEAATGGGLGYSFIAEAYLNFGWTGTPLAMLVIGFLFAQFVKWGQTSNSTARMAAVACFLSFFLVFARSETGTVLRPLVWYALLPYGVAVLISEWKERNQSTSRHGAHGVISSSWRIARSGIQVDVKRPRGH
jgi:oligosaccharide repeat unit polymerase